MMKGKIELDEYELELGRGAVLRDGRDLAIAACGVEVAEALRAAEILSGEGIEARVLNLACIDPLDTDLVVEAARDCGAILVAEEHQVRGGLGDAVAQALSREHPAPVAFAGLDNAFGQSGTADELLAHYGLDGAGLAGRARTLLERKAGA